MGKRLAILSVLSAAVLWGCVGALLKELTALGLSSMQALAVRTIFAALFLLPALLCYNPSLLRLKSLLDLRLFFGTGVLSVLFFNLCYFGAIKRSSLSVAAVLLYTSPIFVVLLSALFFQEPLTRRKIAALVATFVGCVLVSGVLSQGESIGMTAFLLGIGAGFGYSLYSIFCRIALRHYHSLTVTFYTTCFCAAGIALLCLLSGENPIPPAIFASGKGLFLAFGMSVLCYILPFLLYTLGLSGIPTGHAAILATLEPVVAAVLGVMLFQEVLAPTKLLGMALVLSSVLLLLCERPKGQAVLL